jgi:exosortase
MSCNAERIRFMKPPQSITRNILHTRHLLALFMLSALSGLLFFLYHYFGVSDVGYFYKSSTNSLFTWIYLRWLVDFRITSFAFGQWVPLISLLLIWLDRKALSRLPVKTNWFGLIFIVIGFAIHWAGLKTEQTRLSVFSLIVLSWAFPLFICGWPVARRLLFPCGMLLFAMPLNFLDPLVQPLRVMAAAIAMGLLQGLSAQVMRSGPYLLIGEAPGLRMNTAASSAGIFAFVGLIAFSLVCAWISRTTLKKRAAILAVSIPLFLVAIILRALLVALTGAIAGHDAGAFVEEKLAGPIMLLVAYGGTAGLTIFLHDRFRPVEFHAPETPVSSSSLHVSLMMSLVVTLAAAIWIPRHSTVTHNPVAGVSLDIPFSIGSWEGGRILYCHNPVHRDQFFTTELTPGDPCPGCGVALETAGEYEKRLLPPDTDVRKYWHDDGNRRALLSIVLSGKNRSSIHRPEVCLVGEGSQIAHSFTHRVSLADGRKLDVKVLEMVFNRRDASGQVISMNSYFAYWFNGIRRETADHVMRMIWMASDQLFKSESYRWAYISVAGAREREGREYLRELEDFIRAAYPALMAGHSGE